MQRPSVIVIGADMHEMGEKKSDQVSEPRNSRERADWLPGLSVRQRQGSPVYQSTGSRCPVVAGLEHLNHNDLPFRTTDGITRWGPFLKSRSLSLPAHAMFRAVQYNHAMLCDAMPMPCHTIPCPSFQSLDNFNSWAWS